MCLLSFFLVYSVLMLLLMLLLLLLLSTTTTTTVHNWEDCDDDNDDDITSLGVGALFALVFTLLVKSLPTLNKLLSELKAQCVCLSA